MVSQSLVLTVMALLINYSYCFDYDSYSFHSTRYYDRYLDDAFVTDSFSSAIATWYGEPEGAGSLGGACGFGSDVVNPPYNALVTAGGSSLFQSGSECGACYQVKCTGHPSCSGLPITVTITDSCPGCDGDVHFDMSGKAFGQLAKLGQAAALRSAGKINVQYQRTPCHYNQVGLIFKIDQGSNPNYLAFAIENINGDGDVGSVELLPLGWSSWLPMQRSWGLTWKAQLPNGTKGPFSVRVTTIESRSSVVARSVIPYNWAPGQSYNSGVNF